MNERAQPGPLPPPSGQGAWVAQTPKVPRQVTFVGTPDGEYREVEDPQPRAPVSDPTGYPELPPLLPTATEVTATEAVSPAIDKLTREQLIRLPAVAELLAETANRSLELLRIPGIVSQPRPPRWGVIFDTAVGRFGVHYHHVSLEEDMLLLLYDTRFPTGVHFAPNFPGQEVQIEVVSLDGRTNQIYQTRPQANVFSFTLGVFELTLLPVLEPELPPTSGETGISRVDEVHDRHFGTEPHSIF